MRCSQLSQHRLAGSLSATFPARLRYCTSTGPRVMAAKRSGTGDVNLLVLSGQNAPELKELEQLPPQVKVVAVGRTLEDFAGLKDQDWEGVEALLKAGIQEHVATKDHLKAVWPKLQNLRWMHNTNAGVETVLFPELVQSDVVLTNAKGNYSHSLAEYALTSCLWFAKELPRLRAQQKQHKWEPFCVEELRGKTMGVIGYGDIGQAAAELARAFKMNIIALRRRTELSAKEQQQHLQVYPPDKINNLMAASDYIVAALPYTPATDKLINREALQHMRPNGVFVNIGRGTTVDEEALVEVLQQGKIKGAALDVTAVEPLPEDSPLWDLDNVLISPHCADRTTTFQVEAVQQFVKMAKLYAEGQELPNVVDKHAGY